jgi:multiple sugar transport system permease protein
MKRPVTSSPFGTIVENHCAEPLSGVVVGVIKVAGHHLKGTGFPIEPNVEICMKNNLTRKLTPNKNRTAYIMLVPCVVLLLLLTVFPMAFSLRLSVQEYNLLEGQREATFIGLDNYRTIFRDSIFFEILGTTLKFSIITVCIEFLVGLFLALLLDSDLKGVRILKFLIMVPMVVAPIAIGAIWRLLYQIDRGHINYFLSFMQLGPFEWLSNPSIAFGAAVFVDVWKWSPLIALMLYAGLKSIPDEIYEAGRVDGAEGFRSFVYLTFPMLVPYIAVAVSIRFIDSLKTFDYLWMLTGGGPGRTTELLNIYTYRVGMRHFHMGYAAALSLIMVVIAATGGILVNKFFRRKTI